MVEHVEVILAVHDLRRRVDRAVRSVLKQGEHVRALVVCHNLAEADVRESLGDVEDPSRVTFLEHHDSLGSPSGPFNAGIRGSRAEWISIMGSDDELADGAVRAWLAAAGPETDAVIPRLVRGPDHVVVRSPAVRVIRSRTLDAVKDRLSYRSAPLGLVRRRAVDRLNLRLEEGARNGGDLPFVTDLWFGGRITAALSGPAYIEHCDAPVRVTQVAKPAAEELAPVRNLLSSERFAQKRRAEREAIAAKVFRRNVMGAVLKRDGGRGADRADLTALQEVCDLLVAHAPRLPRFLSRADARVLAVLRAKPASADPLARAYRDADRLRSFGALMVADPRLVWHREAPLRYVVASALVR